MNRGVTLVELLVVIALIGIMTSVAAFGMRASVFGATSRRVSVFDAQRRAAILKGVPIVGSVPTDTGDIEPMTFLPDGQVVGAGRDPLDAGPP